MVDVQTHEIVQELEYDEYGNIMKNTNPDFQPVGYAGGLYDSDTKLIRFGARDYDPTIGRWTTKDPIGFAGGSLNLYSYVDGNPMSFSDPNGMDYRVCIRPMNGLPIIPHQYIKLDDGSTISWGPASGMGGPGHNNSSDSGGTCGKNKPSTKDENDAMKDWAKRNEGNIYNFIGNNCFNFVGDAQRSIGR